MRDDVPMTITIDRRLKELVSQRAKATGVSPQDVIEAALKRDLATSAPEERFTAYMRLTRRF